MVVNMVVLISDLRVMTCSVPKNFVHCSIKALVYVFKVSFLKEKKKRNYFYYSFTDQRKICIVKNKMKT